MNKIMTKAVLGATLAATALTVAAPAEAQYYRRHRGGDATGAAIVGGIAGLAIGAAIASNNNRDRYYRDDYYSYNNNYRYNDYNYPQYNNYYYRERYVQRCRIERRYDPYYGGTYRVRVCY